MTGVQTCALPISDLTDRQWQIIKDLLPLPKTGGRPRTVCLRSTFNAMLYLLTTGCQWKMLPQSYPHWRTVYGYFRAWQHDGTWERLHHRLRRWTRRQARRKERPTAGSIDLPLAASTVKVSKALASQVDFSLIMRTRQVKGFPPFENFVFGVVFGDFVQSRAAIGN